MSQRASAAEGAGGLRPAGLSGVWARAEPYPVAVDAIWVVPLALLSALSAAASGGWIALLVVLVQVGVLAVRRVAPVVTAAVVFCTGLAQFGLVVLGVGSTFPVGLGDLAVFVALYSVAAHGPRWARWATLAGALLGSFLLGLSFLLVQQAGADGVLRWFVVVVVTSAVTFALCLLAWTGGQLRRVRLQQLAATAEAAARTQGEIQQRILVAAGDERARIARELHDVVAHSLSVIIAQADGGRYAARTDPVAATTALETVASTGRAALTDMRRLLGVLREEPATTGSPGATTTTTTATTATATATTAPQPGAGDVADLVASVRSSGLDVALTQTGVPAAVHAGVGLALYRGVQEGLTNVLKHAGPGARARVLLAWGHGGVEARVEDDGGGAAARDPATSTSGDGLGRGLRGMRERAAMFGGAVESGPLPGGGFGVRLRLPLVPAPLPSQPVETRR